MSIFVLAQVTRGPAGHGEPGSEYLSLADDGDWGRGKPLPAFTTYDSAAQYATDNDLYSGFEPIELEVI